MDNVIYEKMTGPLGVAENFVNTFTPSKLEDTYLHEDTVNAFAKSVSPQVNTVYVPVQTQAPQGLNIILILGILGIGILILKKRIF